MNSVMSSLTSNEKHIDKLVNLFVMKNRKFFQ